MINIGIITQVPEIQINLDKDLYIKLSKEYKKIYIIDLSFTDKPKKNNFPKNFIYLKPKNYEDIKKIFKKKKFLCFNFLDRNISNIRILLFLKKFDIKHLFVMRSGTINMNENFFIKRKNPINFYQALTNKLFFKILIILNLINNYDILFISQVIKKKFYHSKRNIFFNNLFNTKNFFLYKKIIQINDKTYDLNCNYKKTYERKIISFIDTALDRPLYKISSNHKPNELQKKLFYRKLRDTLMFLSAKMRMNVIICLHPKTSKKDENKYFKGFRCLRHKTNNIIKQSYLTIFLSSTLISESIFLRKKILLIKSQLLGNFHLYRVNRLIEKFNFNYVNIDKDKNIDPITIKKIRKNPNPLIYKKLSKEMLINQKKTGISRIIKVLNNLAY